jgi:hypothetical protein
MTVTEHSDLRIPLGLFAIGTAVKASEDPNSGTRKMDLAKSKYDPGPVPKSSTTTIESDENKYKVDGHTVNVDGTETHISFDAKVNGKDYPLSGVPNADMISVKRVDAKTIETTWKKDGKTVMKTPVNLQACNLFRNEVRST